MPARARSAVSAEACERAATSLVVAPASNSGPVQLNGARYAVAGRVCMDQFVVDIGDAQAAAGDEVVLFGDGAGWVPTAQDWAEAADTISYEIIARMSSRLPRVYLGGDHDGE